MALLKLHEHVMALPDILEAIERAVESHELIAIENGCAGRVYYFEVLSPELPAGNYQIEPVFLNFPNIKPFLVDFGIPKT